MAFAQHNQPLLTQVQLPLRRESISIVSAEIYFNEKNISVKELRPMCYVIALVCENLWSKPDIGKPL